MRLSLRRRLKYLPMRRRYTPGHLIPKRSIKLSRMLQRVCDQVIQRFDGWMAQHFGDGFVVYFGVPSRSHEDNARRAVHTALEIVGSMARLSQEFERQRCGITVRVGIHTGIAVISALGGGDRRVQLALGDHPT